MNKPGRPSRHIAEALASTEPPSRTIDSALRQHGLKAGDERELLVLILKQKGRSGLLLEAKRGRPPKSHKELAQLGSDIKSYTYSARDTAREIAQRMADSLEMKKKYRLERHNLPAFAKRITRYWREYDKEIDIEDDREYEP